MGRMKETSLAVRSIRRGAPCPTCRLTVRQEYSWAVIAPTRMITSKPPNMVLKLAQIVRYCGHTISAFSASTAGWYTVSPDWS